MEKEMVEKTYFEVKSDKLLRKPEDKIYVFTAETFYGCIIDMKEKAKSAPTVQFLILLS